MSQQKSKTPTIDTNHYTSHLYGILNRFVHVEYVSSNTNIIKCFLCIGYYWFIGNDVWRFHLNYSKIILYFTFLFIWSHRHYNYPYRNTNPNGKSECKTLSPIWNKSKLWLLIWILSSNMFHQPSKLRADMIQKLYWAQKNYCSNFCDDCA